MLYRHVNPWLEPVFGRAVAALFRALQIIDGGDNVGWFYPAPSKHRSHLGQRRQRQLGKRAAIGCRQTFANLVDAGSALHRAAVIAIDVAPMGGATADRGLDIPFVEAITVTDDHRPGTLQVANDYQT